MTPAARPTPLARATGGVPLSSHHTVVAAPLARTWDALQDLRWRDAVPLAPRRGILSTLARAGHLEQDEPRYTAVALIGRPWSPDPRAHVALDGMTAFAAFTEPGWLKYGMDWELTALDAERTAVRTSTYGRATDPGSRRAFDRYWWLVGPFSGALRRAMLTALGRLAPAGARS